MPPVKRPAGADSKRGDKPPSRAGTPRKKTADDNETKAKAKKPAERAPDAFLKSNAAEKTADGTPRAQGEKAGAKGKAEAKAATAEAKADAAKAGVTKAAAEQIRSMEANVISAEFSAVVHAAAKAAMECALKAGVAKDVAEKISEAATTAAVQILDPTGAAALAKDGEEALPTADRIENSLARAVKQNAVRTMSIFRDWDENGDGVISKAEFRKAMKALGVEGGRETHDELFDSWDVDSSGAIDFKEMDKALRKATSKLAAMDVTDEAAEEGIFSELNASALTGGVKNANVKLAKERNDASRKMAMERALSPRSQQLKEVEEQQAKQAAYEEELRIAAEDDDQTTWTVPKFLASKGISKVIAAAMQLPPRVSGDASHFKYCKELEKEKLAEALDAANMSGLTEFIFTCLQSLKGQRTGSAEKLNDKFATTAKFQMTYGSLSLFYGGLESLLGPPKMYKGPQHTEKSLFNTMEMEHLGGPDASLEFEANMGIKTTAATEWEVVVSPKEGAEYPERPGYRESHATWCRLPRPLKALLEDMETKCNERLRKDGHSELILEELVAGRLYTGPMYVKYNTTLRSKSKDPAMLSLWKKVTNGNGYPTSIHAINSCVIKLSKLTKAGKVWRGIKDATLPKEFWVPNEMGVRGGIEYAFSSTTVDRDQAMAYAQGSNPGDASTIFEMQMGMVDRGADLTWLSQYPHEREVLLPPLTGIEALGTDVEGSMMIIHSRLSLNLAAHTLEQVLSRRRKMLLDMSEGIELEMRDALGEDLVKLGIRVLNKALAYGPLSKDPEWFNDDENFAHCMQQTLYLQHGITSEIKRLNSDKPELDFKGWKASGPSRILLLAGWCFHRSTLTGGAGDSALFIDLRDAKLTTSEAEQLAELLTSNSRLTSVDVRGNESMGLDGAKALAKFMGGLGKGVTHVPRSLCGVTPSNSSVEVPKSLQSTPVELRLICSELSSHVFSEGITAGMGGKSKGTVLNRRGMSAASEWQPFLWAVKENRMEIAECLLDEFGADINEQQGVTTSSNNSSALHIAAVKGLEEMTKWLLERGIKKDLKDKHNNTPLKLAESKQNTAIITLLGGDPNAMRKGAAD